jgi:hypothetical protein
MGQLSRKHKKNRGVRYSSRKAICLAEHMSNQIGRPEHWHRRMMWRIASLTFATEPTR